MTAGLRGEMRRFLIVGFLTVAVDYVSYKLLLSATVETSFAKAIGFISGSIFAYFANKLWTFATEEPAKNSILKFSLLYGFTLLLNIATNYAVLQLLSISSATIRIAFVVATGLSAATNFIGMKLFVFSQQTRNSA